MTRPAAALRAALVLLAFASASDAEAHSELLASEPADGATVGASPGRIVLRFTAPMRVTSLRLLDGAGREHPLRREGSRAAPAEEVRAAPAAPLPYGAYRVEYRGVSADGHVGGGAVGFRVEPARR